MMFSLSMMCLSSHVHTHYEYQLLTGEEDEESSCVDRIRISKNFVSLSGGCFRSILECIIDEKKQLWSWEALGKYILNLRCCDPYFPYYPDTQDTTSLNWACLKTTSVRWNLEDSSDVVQKVLDCFSNEWLALEENRNCDIKLRNILVVLIRKDAYVILQLSKQGILTCRVVNVTVLPPQNNYVGKHEKRRDDWHRCKIGSPSFES